MDSYFSTLQTYLYYYDLDHVQCPQDKVTDAAIKLDAVEALLEKSEGGSGDDVKDLRGQLCQISEKIQSAKKESYLIEQYRDLVEEGRQQFRKEAAAILGASQGQCG